MTRKLWAKMRGRSYDEVERGAREAVLEQLFNDFNRSRFTIYKFNFFRGIFFGLGTALGGTVVIALLVWLLNLTGNLIPGVADFVNQVVNVMESGRQ